MTQTLRPWRAIGGFALVIGGAIPVHAVENLPFVGAWGGGPTDCNDPFRFTATTYKPPSEASMKVLKREREEKGYRLRFTKG